MTAQDRQAWLEWRTGGIGASDVAAILGISRFASPWSVWAEKVGLIPVSDGGQTELQEAGHWLELAIAPWFADRTGLRVDAAQDTVEHPSLPWCRCTIDGLVWDDGGQAAPLGNIEIKTGWPGKPWDHVPADYHAQALWQQFVGGYERTYFAVLMGRRLDTVDQHPHLLVERDEDEIAFIFDRVQAFWENHVLTGEPPPVDGSDATKDALAAVYGEPESGSHVDLDPDVATPVLDAWARAKADEKDAKARVERYGNELRALLGDNVDGLVNGRKVVSWAPQTRRGLDQKALVAAHPRIAKRFETETPMRVLRAHSPKET